MAARLLYREKYIYSDGTIREMVLWQLPNKTPDRPHGLKYRLYYGLGDGTNLVRFDNESGSGVTGYQIRDGYGCRSQKLNFRHLCERSTSFSHQI